MIAQITEIMSGVDRAATASDRWLFLASLVTLLIGCGTVIKWLVRRMESLDEGHSTERREFAASMASERELERKSRKDDQSEFIAALKNIETQNKSGEIQSKAHTAALEELIDEVRSLRGAILPAK